MFLCYTSYWMWDLNGLMNNAWENQSLTMYMHVFYVRCSLFASIYADMPHKKGSVVYPPLKKGFLQKLLKNIKQNFLRHRQARK